jgi:hypothetical protein
VHQGPEIAHKLAVQLMDVLTGLGGLGNQAKPGSGVAIGERVDQPDQPVAPAQTEDRPYGIAGHLPVAVAGFAEESQLIEQPERVPQAAGRLARDQAEGVLFDIQPFELGDGAQSFDGLGDRNPPKVEALAAGGDGVR